ncbi:MAG: PaaI family thioesterase [Pseudomonadota bacterium]
MSDADKGREAAAENDPAGDLRDRLGRIPYAETLGIQPHFMGEEFTLLMPFRQSNIGNATLPALHGGGVGGFMEVCAIAQLILSNPGRELPRPIGINIDYLRRGRPVDTFARAQIFKQGSRVANVRVRAWQDSFDTPIAALSGHFLLGAEN